MTGLWLISYIALWLLVIMLTVIVLGVVRQLGVIHIRLGPEENLITTHEGLELGTPAPDFHGTDIFHGREVTLAEMKGRESIFVFISPGCRPCQELMPDILSFHHMRDSKINLILFNQANVQESIDMVKTYHLDIPMLSDPEAVLTKMYHVRATPFAYRLDKEGVVRRHGIVNNLDGLEELLQDASSSDVMIELPQPEDESK